MTSRSARSDEDDNKSIGWVVGMLALFVAYVGWAFLAADYLQRDPTVGGLNKREFLANSVTQLPNLPGVVQHGMQNRFWLVVVVVVAEIGVLILWRIMAKLEKEFAGK